MDNTALIVPTFTGRLELSAATLCDFFLIAAEDQVPVVSVVILVDGDKHKFTVGAGKYKSTLFLLYCAVFKQNTTFTFDTEFKSMLAPYFGAELVDQARLPETEHVTLQHLVTGKSIQVNLVLKPGYELPENPGRTLRKLIEHGWKQHDHLDRDTPVPLIREALRAFRIAEHKGAIRIIYSWDHKVWPSDKWNHRVQLLTQKLGIRGVT